MFFAVAARFFAVFFVFGLLLTPDEARAQDAKRSYILTTATTGGTYYPVGVAIAALTKIKLEPTVGLSLSAISSAGSAENIKLLRDGEAQFAILQGIYGAWAAAGEGPLSNEGPQKHLRAITALWRNAEHFVVRADALQSGTLDDLVNLQGRKFSIGKRNSGAEGSGRFILNTLGIDPETTFDLVFQGYGPSADSLQNGSIVGMNIPAGVPVSAVTRAYAALGAKIRVLNFSDAHIDTLNSVYPLFTRQIIPAGTYPSQTEDIATAAQPNLLVARADVSDDDVYQITKAIFENLIYLRGIHKATADISLETALEGLPVPLHPGAEAYYREQGMTPPDHLVSRSQEIGSSLFEAD
jgi:hypothetical protein